MNGLEIIILIGLVVAMAAGVGYFLTKGQPTLKEMTEEPEEKFKPRKLTIQAPTRQVNEAVKEAVGVTESKIKETKETKSEFPIDKPKKKRKYYPKKK
jgi:flagellar basal body-associated protein FliL